MTEIEAFLYDGIDPSSTALLLGKLSFGYSTLNVTFVNSEGGKPVATLAFSDVTITSVWFDETGCIDWPLDIIGFDSYPTNEHWRFVLNCSSLEFVWISAWPSKSPH